jgi:predicted ATP-dependent serine protease
MAMIESRKLKKKFTCPICGEYEFDYFGDNGHCPKCEWYNSHIVDYSQPDKFSGVNMMSINQAKKIWAASHTSLTQLFRQNRLNWKGGCHLVDGPADK